MSLSLVNQKLTLPGDVQLSRVDVTFDSSYPAGGSPLIPSDLGFTQITEVIPVGPTNNGREVAFTGTKLQAFNPAPPVPLAQGRVTLVAGTATITLGSVLPVGTQQSIHLHRAVAGGTLGILQVGTRTAGTSFVINSTSGTDTSVVDWSVWPPGINVTTTGVTGLSGRAVLVAGTITPAQTAVCAVGTPQSIFLTNALTGGTPGRLSVGVRTAGTSVVLNSTNGADTSSVDFLIVPGVAPQSPFVALGRAVLVAGTVVVTGQVAAQVLGTGQQIFLTNAVTGGTPGNLSVASRVAGVGFTINSDNGADTSTVEWGIINAAGSQTEVPNGTDLSSETVKLLVIGNR